MVKAKKTKTPKKKAKLAKGKILEWNPGEGLKPAEELFCRYYILHETTRNNATHSYSLAYGKKLHEAPDDDEVRDAEGVIIKKSTYKILESRCAVDASDLLRKPKIGRRCTELLNEMLTDDFVDGELARVIAQNVEISPKVRAMELYAKLKARITDRSVVEHTFAIDDASDEELDRIINEESKVFKKE